MIIRTRSSDRPKEVNENGLIRPNFFTLQSAFIVEDNFMNITQLGGGDATCFRTHNYVSLLDSSCLVIRRNTAWVETGPTDAAGTVRFFHVLGPRGYSLDDASFMVVEGNTLNVTRVDDSSDVQFLTLTATGWFETLVESYIAIVRNKVITPATMHHQSTREMLRTDRMFIEVTSKLLVAGNAWVGEASAFIGFGWMLVVLCNSWNGQLLGPQTPMASAITDTNWYCPQACASNYPKVNCSLEPIVFGQMTGFSVTDQGDKRLIDITLALYDGMAAAVHAQNTIGGIHGRLIVIDSCDGIYVESEANRCIARWGSSSVSAILGILWDKAFQAVRQHAIEKKKVLVGMLTLEMSTERMYSRNLVYTRPPMDNFFAAGLKKLVGEANLKRVGIVLVSTGLEWASFIDPIVASLAGLGVDFTGIYEVVVHESPVMFYQQPYLSWLARRPQGVLILAHPIALIGFFMIDFLGRAARNAGVDPNAMLITWEGLSIMTDFALDQISRAYPRYSLENRVYSSFSFPAITDDSFEVSAHARREIGQLRRNPRHTENIGASFASNAMLLWVTARATIAMYNALPSTNLTSDALMDSVFNTGLYSVHDLLIGPFTLPCRQAATADTEPLVACGCNQGYNTNELYRLTVNGSSVNYVRDVAARVSVPLSSCGVSPNTVASPLVFVRSPVGSQASDMQLAAHEAAQSTRKTKYSQKIQTLAGTEASDLHQLVLDRILSLAFCLVEDLAANMTKPPQISPGLAAATGLPFVDPYSSLAQLHPATFSPHWIVLSATLQQEIHALCSYVTQSLRRRVVAVIRSIEAHAVAEAITKSANTFGATPGTMTTLAMDTVDLALPRGSGAVVLLVGARSTDQDQIVDYLVGSPRAVVLLAFSELSAMYSTLAAANLSADVSRRIVFATSLRNWNAPDLPSNNKSAFMQSFFTTVRRISSYGWHPLQLRGFVASTAISQVASFMSNSFTAVNVLNAWYLLSVMRLDADDVLGAFSRSKCYSDLDAGCETNTGARVVRIMSLADVLSSERVGRRSSAGFPEGADEYLSTMIFGSGRVPYAPLPPSSSVSIWVIVGAALGGVALVSAALAWVYSRRTSRDNRHAPKDPDKSFTLIFTDIQSSTNLWAAAPETMANVLELHHELIRSLIAKHRCYEVKTIGDAFMIACHTAEQALRLSHELQLVFFNYNWESPAVDKYYAREGGGDADSGRCWNGIRVRVGFHTGMGEIKLDEVTKGYDYYGTVANVAARVESAACGGQVLLTRSAYDELLNGQPSCLGEYEVALLGKTSLKGVPEPVEIFELATVSGRTFKPLQGPNEDNPSAGAANDADVERGLGSLFASNLSETSSQCSGSEQRETSKRSDWTKLSAVFVTTLLAVLPADQRATVIDRLCERWNATAKDEGTLAKRIGAVLQRRYGTDGIETPT